LRVLKGHAIETVKNDSSLKFNTIGNIDTH